MAARLQTLSSLTVVRDFLSPTTAVNSAVVSTWHLRTVCMCIMCGAVCERLISTARLSERSDRSNIGGEGYCRAYHCVSCNGGWMVIVAGITSIAFTVLWAS